MPKELTLLWRIGRFSFRVYKPRLFNASQKVLLSMMWLAKTKWKSNWCSRTLIETMINVSLGIMNIAIILVLSMNLWQIICPDTYAYECEVSRSHTFTHVFQPEFSNFFPWHGNHLSDVCLILTYFGGRRSWACSFNGGLDSGVGEA
jgi:hypothetical protein